MVAHLLCKQGVRGSSPLGSTTVLPRGARNWSRLRPRVWALQAGGEGFESPKARRRNMAGQRRDWRAALAFRTQVRVYSRGMRRNLLASDEDWVPDACTLPTIEQPLRRAEFDALFAEHVIGVSHDSPQRVRLQLRADPDAAARAAGLAVKETGCCSFFNFDLAIADGTVSLDVSAPPAHTAVLAALAARAASRLGAEA